MYHICDPFYTPVSVTCCPWAWFHLLSHFSSFPLCLPVPAATSAIRKPPEIQRAEGDYECTGSIRSENASQEGEDVNHMVLVELYPIHLALLLPLTGLHGILVLPCFFFFFQGNLAPPQV